jgi:hypothetical protein
VLLVGTQLGRGPQRYYRARHGGAARLLFIEEGAGRDAALRQLTRRPDLPARLVAIEPQEGSPSLRSRLGPCTVVQAERRSVEVGPLPLLQRLLDAPPLHLDRYLLERAEVDLRAQGPAVRGLQDPGSPAGGAQALLPGRQAGSDPLAPAQ